MLDSIHFLGSGGWRRFGMRTARGTGEALTESRALLVLRPPIREHVPVAGGGTAIAYLIENARVNYWHR